MVDCRIDHYQTLTEVHVSVFAKKADKELSRVKFEESKVRRIQLIHTDILISRYLL